MTPPVFTPSPGAAVTTTERVVRGAFVVFLVVSVLLIAGLVTRRGDGFPVGTCLRGAWSDDTGGEVTRVDCSEPHDYVVMVNVDDWNDCPPSTVGRLPFNEGGLVARNRLQCLGAA